ncbi:MAG: PEP-CTERM sorting domain-containing protein [Pirellulales bacterium]
MALLGTGYDPPGVEPPYPLAGGGTLYFGDVLVDGGTVNPGASPGSLHINGNYHQLPNGVLTMEVGGINPGTQYGQLLTTGNMLLEGAVNISFIDGFVPQPGDVFDLFGGAAVELHGPLNFLNPPPDFQYKSTFSDGLFSVAVVVPEPSTALLMACGLAGTFVSARRRSKQRNASRPWSPH